MNNKYNLFELDKMQEKKVDLTQFKGHHRKFPWALIFRIIFALVAVGMIWYLMITLEDLQKRNKKRPQEIEIEYQP